MTDLQDETFRVLTKTPLNEMLVEYKAWLKNAADSRNWHMILIDNGWTWKEWRSHYSITIR